uniref:Peptidase A1 domain-containing protein n=1 Tax=Meloidogyne hapla TaxID=6305 RepID=A0A1I8BSJ4_MELHA
MANQQLHTLNLTQRDIFQISVKTYDSSGSCPKGVQSIGGSFQALQMIYNSNISSLFGPICSDDIELIGRLSSTKDLLQFDFWQDNRNNSLFKRAPDSIIQVKIKHILILIKIGIS